MKRKGFTLIELLAVVVILAIIAIITTPMILGVVERAKKGVFKDNVYGIIESANVYIAQHLESESKKFICNGIECVNENGDKLPFKGKVPTSGNIILNETKQVNVEYISDGTYCAYGTLENLIIDKGCSHIDLTEAEIDENKLILSSTTNSITVNLLEEFAQDPESGIKEYRVTLNGEKKKLKEIGSLTFEGLEKNKSYQIKIEVENGKGLIAEVEKESSTLDFENPSITLTNTPTTAVNGYLKNQVAKVTYNLTNISSPRYFIKTTRIGISSVAVTKACGTGTTPSTCNNITDTTTLSANTWYQVSGNVNVTYSTASSETATIYAITYDGTNYSGASTGTINKIDITRPAVNFVNSTVTPTSIKVNYTLSDTESGVGTIACQYKTENSSYQSTESSNISKNSCIITGLTQNTNYLYQVCVTDQVGNGPICINGNATTSNQTNSNLTVNNKVVSNLMIDGGFDNSDISYIYNDDNYSWENGTLKVTVNTTQKFLRKNLSQVSGLTNHILYARVATKKTNASLEPGLYVITASEFGYWHDNEGTCVDFDNSDTVNTWKNVSCLVTSKYDKLTNVMVAQANNKASGIIYFDNFLILDLTEIFGSGNEPTQEWCDKNIVFPQS